MKKGAAEQIFDLDVDHMACGKGSIKILALTSKLLFFAHLRRAVSFQRLPNPGISKADACSEDIGPDPERIWEIASSFWQSRAQLGACPLGWRLCTQ